MTARVIYTGKTHIKFIFNMGLINMYNFIKKMQYGRFEQIININVNINASITYAGVTRTVSNDKLPYELGKIENDISNKLLEQYNVEQETIRILDNLGYEQL